MRISDWSSDVCSSDLDRGRTRPRIPLAVGHGLDCPRAGRRDGGDPAHAARAADRYARAYRDFAAADLGRGGARAQPRLSRQGRADQRALVPDGPARSDRGEIGRASGTERECQYVKSSVVAVPLRKNGGRQHDVSELPKKPNQNNIKTK